MEYKRLTETYHKNLLAISANETTIKKLINRLYELEDKIEYGKLVEVVHNNGDVCLYGFAPNNKSLAVVQIVKILDDIRGIAEIKFLKVITDDTGNGLFNYLFESQKTMNASFKYLKNITPKGADKNND